MVILWNSKHGEKSLKNHKRDRMPANKNLLDEQQAYYLLMPGYNKVTLSRC